jgi:hypothetical protein
VDHRRWFVAAAAAAVLAGYSHSASGQQSPRPTVAVLAYDYARVPADVLAAARDKAISVFQKAGVDVVWTEPLSGVTACGSAPAECRRTGLFVIQVMIRARQAKREPGCQRIMGVALAADDERAVLSLFYDAVVDVARRFHTPLDDILAVALAHEMGHVLLPPPSHSSTGIMQAKWDGDDIRHAVGWLAFTQAQADTIRAKAERRSSLTAERP